MIPKFRAWDTTEQCMCSVDYMNLFDGYYEYKYFGKDKSISGKAEFDNEKIILMQSTGLKDKNGVEIFEGDIFKKATIYPNGKIERRIGFIKFNIDELQVIFCGKTGKWAMCGKKLFETSAVAGNIYENPELMEE